MPSVTRVVRTAVVASALGSLAVLSLGVVAVEGTAAASGSHASLDVANVLTMVATGTQSATDTVLASTPDLQFDHAPRYWTQPLSVFVAVGLLAGAFVTGRLTANPSTVEALSTRVSRIPRLVTASSVSARSQPGEDGRTPAVARTHADSTSTTSAVGAPQREKPITDERRVCDLLESADGRLRQTQVVEMTDWSKSKVSQTLTALADDDVVVKVRVGRENLICLPDEVPDVCERPFDE